MGVWITRTRSQNPKLHKPYHLSGSLLVALQLRALQSCRLQDDSEAQIEASHNQVMPARGEAKACQLLAATLDMLCQPASSRCFAPHKQCWSFSSKH